MCIVLCVRGSVCVYDLAHEDKTKNRATEIYLTFENVIVHKNQK